MQHFVDFACLFGHPLFRPEAEQSVPKLLRRVRVRVHPNRIGSAMCTQVSGCWPSTAALVVHRLEAISISRHADPPSDVCMYVCRPKDGDGKKKKKKKKQITLQCLPAEFGSEAVQQRNCQWCSCVCVRVDTRLATHAHRHTGRQTETSMCLVSRTT